MIALNTRFMTLAISPETASFSLSVLPEEALQLQNASLEIETLQNGRPAAMLRGAWPGCSASSPSRVDSVHGPLTTTHLDLALSPAGLVIRIDFALAESQPICLWRLSLENLGANPITVHRLVLFHASAGSLCLGSSANPPADLGFFSNGWQSWAPTAAYRADQAQRHTRLKPLVGPMLNNPGTPQPSHAGQYASDFFGVVGHRKSRLGWAAGFLSQKQHFGALEAHLDPAAPGAGFTASLWANGDDARLDPGAAITTDWAVLVPLGLDDADPLGVYLDAVARENAAITGAPILSGWCSWYQYYDKVTAQDVQSNLNAVTALHPTLPLTLFQIDDGYETHAGDWSSFRPTFPQGVAPLAEAIRQAGMTPGLWMAPFLVHPRARLASDHPEFLLRNLAGRPVNAGFVWNTLTRALDLTHPGALDYACQAVTTAVHTWGFSFLKLDFLYAGALAGQHTDPRLTRAQILRRGLEALREAAGPEAYLLGCGVPLGSAIGLVQAMRIGEDVSGDWNPRYFGTSLPFRDEWAMPSARNALLNILTRAPLHARWWVNDPDCLLVRTGTRLTLAEIHSMATAIALTGGSLLLSDDLTHLDEERLDLARSLTPVIGKPARLLDWFDTPNPCHLRVDLSGPAGAWHLLGLFNWSNQAQPLALDLREFDLPVSGSYWAYSHWEQQIYSVEDGKITLNSDQAGLIPPHGAALIAVRAKTPQAPQFLGSSLTLSQGLELQSWQVSTHGVRLSLDLPRHAAGTIVLALPDPISRAWQDDRPLIWKGHAAGCYSFDLKFERTTEIKIETNHAEPV